MKKIKILLVSLTLLLILVVTPFSVYGKETKNKKNYYNIELVVDASGSLKRTDREKNRFIAIDIFLQTLRDSGNYAGAVVFTEDIQVDTGLSEMKNKTEKDKLSKEISKIEADKGDTNIGMALDTAVKRLNAMDNGLDNVILLISDGNSDLKPESALQNSLRQKDGAIQNCITNNIPVYGICLNSNGGADINEFIEMTQKTNGDFLEVKSSSGLVNALRDFYAQIFKTTAREDNVKTDQNGYLKKPIAVPSYGIAELNITINNASKINNLSITKPDGIKLSETEVNGVSSKIGDYCFIKLSKPMGGTWILELHGEKNTDINFSYVYNSDYKAELTSASSENSFSIGEDVKLFACFKENGKKITGTDNYKDYSATLVLNFADEDNENTQYYSMKPDGDNGFKTNLSYDQVGNYKVHAVFNCGDFEVISNEIIFSVGNSTPSFKEEKIKIRKIFNNSKAIDLREYFKDIEDKKLKYTLVASSYDGEDIEINGNELLLNNLTDGSITVKAVDSAGASVTGVLEVSVQNLLFIIFIVLAILVILIVLLIAKKKKDDIDRVFEGTLSVYSASPDVDDYKSIPVQNFKGKVFLRDFCLEGTNFSKEAYFKVIKDNSSRDLPKGNFSHKLRFVSPREFYYSDASGERKIKELELQMNMEYVIRSHSEQDYDAVDDSITINLTK